jgi:hypothetical protein
MEYFAARASMASGVLPLVANFAAHVWDLKALIA